jgi:uncharacterized protein (DUF433 family)
MYNGTGIYTLTEAARLIDVPAQKIHRWLYGYTYHKGSGDKREKVYSEPLWSPQLSKSNFDDEVIGFNDLLEVRFVSAFVSHGVPLAVVRECLRTAKEIAGTDFPMSSGLFKTDGKTIFAEALKKHDAEGLIDLKNRQLAFKAVISPSLYAGIEYSGKKASRWYPRGKREQIVLDPLRQFGRPIVDEVGTPTDVLYASYVAEGENQAAEIQTARTYQVPQRFVKAAIRFEESLGSKRTVH